MKAAALLVSIFLAPIAAAPAFAQDYASPDRFAFGVGLGTNGALVEGAYRLNNQFSIRGQGAFIDFDDGFHSGDVKYSGRLHFNTGGGFVDWHPWSNPWLLSAGAVAGDRSVDLHARPSVTGALVIHGVSYPVSEVGEVNGTADFGSPSPFVGFGWDNTFYSLHKIGFRAIAGVIFGGGSPDVNLHAVGPYATDPAVVADVQAEQSSLAHDIRDYQYYPVVQLGINYRF